MSDEGGGSDGAASGAGEGGNGRSRGRGRGEGGQEWARTLPGGKPRVAKRPIHVPEGRGGGGNDLLAGSKDGGKEANGVLGLFQLVEGSGQVMSGSSQVRRKSGA